MTDQEGTDPEMQARLDAAVLRLAEDASYDVAGLEWSLEFDDGLVLRTRAREEGYVRRTNAVGLIGPVVVERAQLDAEGAVPFDGVPASRIVELLNRPGCFGLRPMLPSPDDEDKPDFMPFFQLYVSSAAEFVSLATPTWNEVGHFYTFELRDE